MISLTQPWFTPKPPTLKDRVEDAVFGTCAVALTSTLLASTVVGAVTLGRGAVRLVTGR